jgi:uroporphyrinogen III methyltransferase / synthase
VVPVYRTIAATPDPEVLERIASGSIDAVTFTSGSTVRNFIALLEAQGLEPREVMGRLAIASIGPVTSEALTSRGFEPAVEAAESTMSSLADAVGTYLSALG